MLVPFHRAQVFIWSKADGNAAWYVIIFFSLNEQTPVRYEKAQASEIYASGPFVQSAD